MAPEASLVLRREAVDQPSGGALHGERGRTKILKPPMLSCVEQTCS